MTGGLETRVQIVAILVTALIFIFVLELVRRRRLVERYALLWMIAAVALLTLAIWRDLLDSASELLGIAAPPNALFLVAFGVIFVLLLHFSVATSRLSEETKILAQEVTRLDAELRAERGQTRRANGGGPDGASLPPPARAQRGGPGEAPAAAGEPPSSARTADQ